MRARTSSSSMPGGVRQSTASVARDGMTLIFSEAKMRVGASVTPSIGSTIIARIGSRSRSASSTGAGIAVEREAELGQQRARRLGDVVGRLAVAHRLQEGDHLQQRVLAHLRRRGVAGDAVGASP